MPHLLNVICDWVCQACGHRNPVLRMRCRRCRTDRPLGS
jgi:ribosomal protein L40E